MNNIKFYNNGEVVLSFEKAQGYMLGSASIAVQATDTRAEIFNLSAYDRITIEQVKEEVTGEAPDNVVKLH